MRISTISICNTCWSRWAACKDFFDIQSGAFVAYLIKIYGLDKVLEVYQLVGWDDTKETIMTKFKQVFGVGIQEVENAWLAYLEATP